MLAAGSGEPGGEGGMLRLGIGGSVMSRIKARVVEKGEDLRVGVASFEAGSCD